MSVIRLAAMVAFSSVLSVSAVFGQNLRSTDGPAEVPPASFTASQYVDSKGCVYVRAGFAGQVQWVPRVSRARQLLCGMQPSLGTAERAPAVASAPTPRAERPSFGRPLPTVALTTTPPNIGSAAQARRAAAQAASAAQAREAAAAAQRARQAQAAAEARAAAQAAAVAPRATAPLREATAIVPRAAPVQAARVVNGPSRVILPVGNRTCTNRSALGARYTNAPERNVRCGPQTEDPVGNGTVFSNPKRDSITEASPRKKRNRGAAVLRIEGAAPRVPKGYRRVWDDGRLNPNRGLPKGASF